MSAALLGEKRAVAAAGAGCGRQGMGNAGKRILATGIVKYRARGLTVSI